MIVSTGYNYIAFSTNKVFISHKMVTTGIAQPGKQQTDKIVPEIIDITHAAKSIFLSKE
jgi:hypothetical protein